MKSKIVLAFGFLVATTVFYSCSKSKVAFTNATMKPWFDSKCASCHASGKSDAGSWTYDPTDYQTSIVGHIEHLKEQIHDKKTMPPTGATVAEITAFKTWYDAGYPAN